MGKFAVLLCLILTVCLGACSGESELVEVTTSAEASVALETATSTTVPPTVTPEPLTDTPVPPTLDALDVILTQQALTREVATSIPTRSIATVHFEVVFDGNGCTYSGSTGLTTGYHSFVFKDLSDQYQQLGVGRILGGGYNYQDLLDLQSEPGEFYPAPAWIAHPPRINKEWDESVGGEVYTFRLEYEGEYYLALGSVNPQSLWFCSPLQVVRDPG